MSSFKRDEKEEDTGENPYQNLDKTIVLQDARYFNETPVNPRKCIQILTKILYILNQGENLTVLEATDAFFAITKLFQLRDVMLRRMVYLCIKELSTLAEDVIIVTSSLTKDMTGKEDVYRAAAIRALCCITDSSMLQAIERYMKQAIVDKNAAVSSAALVSALHLSANSPDSVWRWTNEAQEAISSDNAMVTYHALGLVAAAKKNDKLSTMKLVTKYYHKPIKSPYTTCLLIRIVAKLIEDGENELPFVDFIERCLQHKSEMVIYEAAHALVSVRRTAKDLAPAISVLQLFCGSSKPSLRLAGARTLARLTATHPSAVSACAVDLENLISDSNRSVATLAVTTLLATGTESSIDRLLKQISGFFPEIPDEFKILIVRAIRKLCIKFPRKHLSLAHFLATMLRNEGGLEYKAAIADAIIELVEENPVSKDLGIAHLCEFIEDCEHATLAIRILHLVGREGPKCRHPSRYIRFIYNRVILESGPVRAAAVSAVAQFGAQRPELLDNIRILLQRCQVDEEDEVRDRAVYYSAILDSGDPQLINDYIINVPKLNPLLLDKALRVHLETKPDEPFDINTVPAEEIAKKSVIEIMPSEVSLEEKYRYKLSIVPELEKMGYLFKTMPPQDLTEPETEYKVSLVKHIFAKHIVLQFECVNTLSDRVLEQISVEVYAPSEYDVTTHVMCSRLLYNKPGSVFVAMEFPSNFVDSLVTLRPALHYRVKECDPITGVPDPRSCYKDSYPLEEFDIDCSCQIRAEDDIAEDFDQIWDSAVSVPEVSDTFVLRQNDVGEAANAFCEHLGLSKQCISGDAVKEIRACGVFRTGASFLLKAKLAAGKTGVTMKLAARSPKLDVAQLIFAAVG